MAPVPGRSGVGIVRVSGPASAEIARGILDILPKPRYAAYGPFKSSSGEVLDIGLALYFVGPHSFTGEDVLELQGHGGPVVLDLLLQRCIELGARPARPGEFTERAFLNDKMDLVQAEAVADLIDSATVQGARLALRALQGAFSARVNELLDKLVHLRMYVESAMDFPDEELDFLSDGQISVQLQTVSDTLQQTLDAAQQGSLVREGIRVVIAGRPNAGKSTLMNQLTGRDSAIVTDIAGTTRDVLREQIHLDGLPLHVMDTAGLRESMDPVEREGVRRAWSEIEKADRILYLIDATHENNRDDEALLRRLGDTAVGITIVHNKIDQIPTFDLSRIRAAVPSGAGVEHLGISAKTGVGLPSLRQHLKDCVGYQAASEGQFMARRRHVDALHRALQHVQMGQQHLSQNQTPELLAEELRLAQNALSEVTGAFTPEDLLSKIFASFCIGK